MFFIGLFLKSYTTKCLATFSGEKISMIRTKRLSVVNVNHLFLTADLCNIKYFYIHFKVADDMICYMI